MSQPRLPRLAPMIAAGSLAIAAASALAGPPNLLVNPGAETGDTSGWTLEPAGAPIEAATSVDQTTGFVLPLAGEWLFSFAGAAQDGTISMRQGDALPADAGRLRLTGSFQTEFEDFGEAVLRLRDADGLVLRERSSGELTGAELRWTGFEARGRVPAAAAAWEVELRGTLAAGTFINVFWDELELVTCRLADVDCDGTVDLADLLAVLSAWGSCDDCPEDFDGDGAVTLDEVLAVLSAWD